MDIKEFLVANRESTGIMADIKRGLRTSAPSNMMLRHLAAAGVDIRKQVLPEALLAYSFSVSGSLDHGHGVGVAAASLETSGSTAYTGKGKTLSSIGPMEKRLLRMSGRPVSDCVQEIISLVDRSAGGVSVNPLTLEKDIRAWENGEDVPITRWVFEYHKIMRGE